MNIKKTDNSISPNFIGNIIGGVKIININNDDVEIIYKNKKSEKLLYSSFTDFPFVKSGIFGSKLHFKYQGRSCTFRFLKTEESKQAAYKITQRVKDFISKMVADVCLKYDKYAVEEYLRDSNVEHANKCIQVLLKQYKKNKATWSKELDTDILHNLDRINSVFPVSENLDSIRNDYETSMLTKRKSFYDEIESNPLTEKQRLAVIRNNDYNLVLAAAGTGKTSVMVAKSLDLINSEKANPNDILMLAYSRDAAKELRERVHLRGKKLNLTEAVLPKVSTFHALGRHILKEAKITTYLSDFSEDTLKLKIWVTNWLIDYIKKNPSHMDTFIGLSHQPVNPFEFKTKGEYETYIRDNEFRTLQNERVKGYQELLIANWLFVNGIEYEYESPYVSKRRIEIGFDYRPDFHIKDTNIYLEHFGIDRQGKTRKDIDRVEYNEIIKKKRALHIEYETKLLETFHYDWIEDNLESRLEELMSEENIEIKRKTPDELFESLNNCGFIEEASGRYLKCLQAIRAERLSKEKILERLNNYNIIHSEKYTTFLDVLHQAYVDELIKQDRIDFDDMIIRSTNAIKNGEFKPAWKHILVDEFQDISTARMEFLNELISHGPNPTLTVVGDDWQAIYRFSGGKLELTTRFAENIGSHSLTKLEKTFRYNNSIADTAGLFIMKNPEQYEKDVVTHTIVDEPQVYLLDSNVDFKNNIEERVVQVINTIRKNDSDGTIAILSRYRYLINDVRKFVNNSINDKHLRYWTFHGSKGLEADYCILVGFIQGKSGFPNENKDEVVVEALLPSLDSFPHSEERRLFYVALTRARKKSYLIADPIATSDFINEIINPRYKLHIVSKTFEEKYRRIFKCPMCEHGYFKLKKGKYGEFYSCTSGAGCKSKPRMCKKCDSPSIDSFTKSICNNIECRNEKIICERCGRPMKITDGRFGRFLGCTGYGIKHDQCKNTKKI